MKFGYLNTKNIYPHDIHLIDGWRALGHEIIEINETGGIRTLFKLAKRIRREAADSDALVVGFTSPLLVLSTIFSGKKIIFNATSSQYEANVVSRSGDKPNILIVAKWWIIDFLSFHLSTKVLLESNAQVEYVHKLFFVPRKKLIKSYSGLDEKEFFYIPNITKRKDFTVLFRGRFLPESGILTVLEAAKELENTGIKFLIIGHGYLYREVNALLAKVSPKNIEMITERISIEKLREMMLSSHVSLGQMADHERLLRTLPCKLFETLALKLPYLTGSNPAALELLTDGFTCITSKPGDTKDLVEKIKYLKNNPSVCDTIAENGYSLYKKELMSKFLAQKVINDCLKYNL